MGGWIGGEMEVKATSAPNLMTKFKLRLSLAKCYYFCIYTVNAYLKICLLPRLMFVILWLRCLVLIEWEDRQGGQTLCNNADVQTRSGTEFTVENGFTSENEDVYILFAHTQYLGFI